MPDKVIKCPKCGERIFERTGLDKDIILAIIAITIGCFLVGFSISARVTP